MRNSVRNYNRKKKRKNEIEIFVWWCGTNTQLVLKWIDKPHGIKYAIKYLYILLNNWKLFSDCFGSQNRNNFFYLSSSFSLFHHFQFRRGSKYFRILKCGDSHQRHTKKNTNKSKINWMSNKKKMSSDRSQIAMLLSHSDWIAQIILMTIVQCIISPNIQYITCILYIWNQSMYLENYGQYLFNRLQETIGVNACVMDLHRSWCFLCSIFMSKCWELNFVVAILNCAKRNSIALYSPTLIPRRWRRRL